MIASLLNTLRMLPAFVAVSAAAFVGLQLIGRIS
jgi:hypothetical protein